MDILCLRAGRGQVPCRILGNFCHNVGGWAENGGIGRRNADVYAAEGVDVGVGVECRDGDDVVCIAYGVGAGTVGDVD
jgi:hypothetical protein